MYRKQLCMFALGLALVFAAGASAELGQGKVLIEYWFGNGVDSNLDNLKANAAFPDNPASSEWLDAFERADWANMDYFAGRLRAYLTPPQTGEYTFWTSSDDDSEVWLSTDDTAANAKLICSVEGWTGYRNYAGTEGVVGPNQKSAAIALEAGKRYYIEGLFTDGTGGGHMSVGWAGPGIGDVATPIGSAYVTALIRDPEPLFGAQNPNPADGAVDWQSPLLQWKPGMFATAHKVYLGTTPELTEANLKMTWPATMTVHPVAEPLVPGATYYWRVDEVEATGVRTGPVWSFTVMPLTAHFPSPTDGAMYRQTNITVSWTAGQNADKYKVYGGEDQAAVAAGDAKALLAEQVETSLDASALLQPGKTYYWRVDTIDLSGVLQAGPVWTFSTYDPAGGAVAQYWPNKFLAGEPNVVTTVGEVNFNWPGAVPGVDSPDALIPVDNFSCRWTAELNIPVTGTYKFYAASDDGARMFLNGKVLTNFWVDRGTTENASADIELVAGQRYQIVMEMYEAGGGASAYLRWSGPGIAKEIIPQGILQPPAMAFSPSPATSATDVADTAKLSWFAGKGATTHNLFLGTDEALVTEGHASVAAGALTETSFDPGQLGWGVTYYWKVDEVAADGTVVPGLVWSFTTIGHSVIDDFEAYDLEPATPVNAAIGWWKLNGDLVDSSGKGHDGKMIGTGGFEDDAVMGKVLDLPGGDNQYVEIGAVGISGNMPTTIACWAKADNTNIPDWTLIFGFTGDAAGAGGNGSHFNIDVIGGPGGVGAHCWGWEETIFTDQESLEWHHYAMTYDGTTIRYFADGFAKDTDPGKSNVQNLAIRGDRVFIGKRVTAANSFPGNVSDARVYDYALSPTEIMSVAGVVPTVLVTDAWKASGSAVPSVTADYVHGGGQAMDVAYNDAGEVTFTRADSGLGGGSAKTLSLWFYGDSTSTAGQMYAKLDGQKVALKVDPKAGEWQAAVVDIAKLGLASLTSIAIGVDGGAGVMTIDDVMLNAEGMAPPVAKPVVVWVTFHPAADTPSQAAKDAGFTEAPDKAYTDLLEADGYEVVRYIQTGTPDVNLLNAADLVIVSRSVASGSFNKAAGTAWNTTVTAPMIVMNGYLSRKSRLGFMTASTLPDITGDIKLTATDPTHPIFAGISLTNGTMANAFAGVPVYPTDGTAMKGISVVTDPLDGEGTVIATLAEASGTVTAGSVVIAELPAGATVEHDGPASDVLAGPRLVFLSGARENGKSAETAGVYDLTPDGAQLFLNAVAYMIK